VFSAEIVFLFLLTFFSPLHPRLSQDGVFQRCSPSRVEMNAQQPRALDCSAPLNARQTVAGFAKKKWCYLDMRTARARMMFSSEARAFRRSGDPFAVRTSPCDTVQNNADNSLSLRFCSS
jgi:hypothetical protein